MSPKAWSNKVTITEKQIEDIVRDHVRSLSRLGWKAMDPMEFAEAHLDFMKSLARHTVRLNKQAFAAAVRKCKTGLSSSEVDLLTEKVTNCISAMKKRLRDAGSGVRLPGPAQAMQKAWKKHETKSRPKKGKEEKKQEKEQEKKKRGTRGL